MTTSEPRLPAAIYLVGAGVVGRAILRAHLDAGIPVTLVDMDREALQRAAQQDTHDRADWSHSPAQPLSEAAFAIHFESKRHAAATERTLVIESIAERLELKQAFFKDAEQRFAADAILCSNTSTLRIHAIAQPLQQPDQFCGMHFFMPVYNREAVELIASEHTSRATIETCKRHVQRLNKQPLVVSDGPGFIVNRLLSPYLNEAMLLLCSGTSAEQIEQGALRYGMPMSPLELIDWIGIRTMFDAGRVFWQAFPDRINPSPLLAGLVKRKRLGRAGQGGCYDYVDSQRSTTISPVTAELAQQYSRHQQSLSDDQVMQRLAIPMWIEGALALRDRIATSADQLNQAMQGGLGYRSEPSWLAFFDQLGADTILQAAQSWGEQSYALRLPDGLREWLQKEKPSEAVIRWASPPAEDV